LLGIVGPNGCGKSNLLEAVCFACGCSTAVLRGCRSFKDVTSTDAGSQVGVRGRQHADYYSAILQLRQQATCSGMTTGLAGTLRAAASAKQAPLMQLCDLTLDAFAQAPDYKETQCPAALCSCKL
jgi:recombinational DNA repair ATPase RecF